MKKIQKTICREELKSRIPGLFAYLEENDDGEFKLHKATDSINGCHGKIIENIRLPHGVSLIIDDETLLEANNIYSYRTLMNYYYQYKDELSDSNNFKQFIVNGIGKIEINFGELGLDEQVNDIVPHYIYLATVNHIINAYSKLKIVYDLYGNTYQDDPNKLESDICCACSKYIRMGGNIMYDKLLELSKTADAFALYYYDIAEKEDNTLSINFNINLEQSIHDIGYLSCYINNWVGGDKHFKDDLYTYGGNTYICVEDNCDTYDEKLMSFVFDEKYFQLVSKVESTNAIMSNRPNGIKFESVGDDYTIVGSADSKLKSLRRYKQYINGANIIETPADDEDWLFYYRKGLVINYTTINDEFGNIVSNEGLLNNEKIATDDVDDLAAYGNAIIDIIPNKEDLTITFKYILNAHLKAKECILEIDDDGNQLYKFDGFYVDEHDKYHGVIYAETYNYEKGGELDNLVNDKKFDDYIISSDNDLIDFNKYAFSTKSLNSNYNKELDSQIISISYLHSDYYALIKNEVDYMYLDTFKIDYLDGITYKPEIENSVYINRGNYSAFERHIRLSEVKTLEDMENYSNGSFFNVQKSN